MTDGSYRSVANLLVEWIDAACAIDQQDNRNRKLIFAEVLDFLLDAVLDYREVFAFEIADDATGLLLHRQHINQNKIGPQSQGLIVRRRLHLKRDRKEIR